MSVNSLLPVNLTYEFKWKKLFVIFQVNQMKKL